MWIGECRRFCEYADELVQRTMAERGVIVEDAIEREADERDAAMMREWLREHAA